MGTYQRLRKVGIIIHVITFRFFDKDLEKLKTEFEKESKGEWKDEITPMKAGQVWSCKYNIFILHRLYSITL